MDTYEVTYTRLGRTHEPTPDRFEVTDADELAEKVYRRARQHLISRAIEVVVDLEKGTGHVFAGFQNAGEFTVKKVEL